MELRQTYIFSLSSGVCLDCVSETPHHSRVQALLSPPATSSQWGGGQTDGSDVFAVRLIPANHCPGAVMFLFVSSFFGTVLHTGDFRFSGLRETWQNPPRSSNWGKTYVPPLPCLIQRSKEQHALTAAVPEVVAPSAPLYEQFIADDEALQDVARRQLLDVLFLDNTFCSPAYKFPSQWKVTQTVIEVLLSLFHRAACCARAAVPLTGHPPRRQVRCAVLIGCYTIGKERVALALRDAFPGVRSAEQSHAASLSTESQRNRNAPQPASWCIYVSPSRYRLLSSMRFFETCFKPLKASDSSEKAASPRNAGSNASSGPLTETAHVEDVPVLLPVMIGAPSTQVTQRKSVATDIDRTLEESGASPATPVRESSAVAEGQTEEVEHLLSVFLVPMANVGYRTVVALAHTDGPAMVNIEDGLALDLERYDQVLIVEPTGWCKRCASRDVSEKYTLLRVPYSEHCAFHELLQFVQFVNPACVVPTVSEESFKQHEALFVEKAPRLRSRVSGVQPITRFFSVSPLSKTEAARDKGKIDMEATVPCSATAMMLGGSSGLLARAERVNKTVVDDTRTAATDSAVGWKRVRAEVDATTTSVLTLTTRVVSATSSTPCHPECLFQKVTREEGRSVAATQHLEEMVVGEEDDCQVVRVVQTVVEISDDD
ncbi:conserved hypothetical protein [Leishmania braziliensis MHOM/BR/75/M2904]|uniref:Protein artemis n=2 Tax=Leishmania braziliensis TaxID=5660 RepID=A4HB44_LEIBR|nr:conserved hypothetical protein [Leishmania braziliensis MHOM/BR/75/M2904]KAI5686554.1 DNA repair metallobetalactamase [Leishmania braziliensis]CAJ2471535.1 unnamed protein product [Leishmania braziliensis]CAM38630.1 conserved hypothetical protein [Leishmania braziliensis MHOM/BR/75/M2904]SYZ65325.1 DNA_repair_metallo-beta-lactamase [Leishmania braziliensis MHOM/BR/75/M2904]